MTAASTANSTRAAIKNGQNTVRVVIRLPAHHRIRGCKPNSSVWRTSTVLYTGSDPHLLCFAYGQPTALQPTKWSGLLAAPRHLAVGHFIERCGGRFVAPRGDRSSRPCSWVFADST